MWTYYTDNYKVYSRAKILFKEEIIKRGFIRKKEIKQKRYFLKVEKIDNNGKWQEYSLEDITNKEYYTLYSINPNTIEEIIKECDDNEFKRWIISEANSKLEAKYLEEKEEKDSINRIKERLEEIK